jgi:DNA-binding MarR family transcriptional regulator
VTGPATGPVPLTALLSPPLVAYTIEFDNEFEHQMPHRTTRHGATPGTARAPWLVSMVMWSNCMQYVPDEGIAVRDLARRARLTNASMRLIVTRMGAWWGYLALRPDPARPRPTENGRRAQQIWRALAPVIENRFTERSGTRLIDELKGHLGAVAGRLDVALPDYLPVGDPRLEPAGPDEPAEGLLLPVLLSRVLLALALEFDRESPLPLAVCANVLRVLTEEGLAARDVPARAGVAKETVNSTLGRLSKSGHLVAGSGPDGGRARMVRLTPRGRAAQQRYYTLLETIERRWAERFGADRIRALRDTLERLAGDPAEPSALLRGIEPYPDGWRASLPAPRTLPHYPLVLHRGGFPDGS